MKKLILIVAILLGGIVTNAQEQLSNIVINIGSDSVSCLFNSKIDTAYHGSDYYINKQLIADSLNPQLANYIKIVERDYIKSGDTLVAIQYQNVSQSFTGYERFWIISKNNSIDLKVSDLSPQLQESIYLFGIKIIGNIHKQYYHEN